MSRTALPLGTLLARRIILFALLAMLAQLIIVLVQYASDPANLSRLMLERETQTLAEGFSKNNTALRYELPQELRERYGVEGSGYAARVRTPSGVILFSRCGATCTEHFLPLELNPPTFWLRTLADGYPLSFAGGRTVDIEGQRAFIEIAIEGDPQGALWGVFADEVIEHMLVPMSLTLIFVLGASLYSIRSALKPVRHAARAATRLDPMKPDSRLSTEGMPLEIARLADAVNRSYERVRKLTSGQKLFTSAIAHEIRTPLTVIRLELEMIDHPRARRAIEEVDELSHFLEQMVALARLESVDRTRFSEVHIDALLEEVVGSMAQFVYANGASIAFEPSCDPVVSGCAPLLRDAVRNLIENAVRHGGPGVVIRVLSTDDGRINVVDDGIGFEAPPDDGAPGHFKRSGGLGIGLEIVRRICELHAARFQLKRAAVRGTIAEVAFPAAV
ncbi:sensor histidine kinase [Ancylobacter defluvii]|uniref:histidine kinase n=1 Tax=Ancylobacter defluvii TaxID=1282440 RepID=A0A9W6N9G7_9HYPH|nr:HAMP domain-containing sensor histidine kinase [Ancylobacter defluvii]MBS7587596.1 HAMP domain-containing histidine kinase [Ancylobacter defluvii]GLK82406.1 two-component sensor histidine kinase [Ancylobacter defluvii]